MRKVILFNLTLFCVLSAKAQLLDLNLNKASSAVICAKWLDNEFSFDGAQNFNRVRKYSGCIKKIEINNKLHKLEVNCAKDRNNPSKDEEKRSLQTLDALKTCIKNRINLERPGITAAEMAFAFPELGNNWSNHFMIGYKLQNDFNEEGENLGLRKSTAIGGIVFTGRWNFIDPWSDLANRHKNVNTVEIGTLFGQAPVNNENDANNVKIDGFNAVSDTLDAYVKIMTSPAAYFLTDWMAADEGSSMLSLGLITGFRTQDEIKTGDELTTYVGAGLEWKHYGIANRVNESIEPLLSVSFFWLKPERWGNIERPTVHRVSAQYQLAQNKPFVFGIEAAFGPRGRDDYGVSLRIKQPLDKMADFFGLRALFEGSD